MLKNDQFVQIGQVLKSNGTDGQVVISLSGIDAEDISEKEPVFIFFDELPVPYFISDAQRRGSNKILAYLTDTTTLEDAEELAGRGIYLRDEEGEGSGMDLTGWTLICVDTESGEMVPGADITVQYGILGIEDIPGNPCLIIDNRGEEILVPLHEDLIVEMDESTKTLRMNLPEGLL